MTYPKELKEEVGDGLCRKLVSITKRRSKNIKVPSRAKW
jgi:hypothetical protein